MKFLTADSAVMIAIRDQNDLLQFALGVDVACKRASLLRVCGGEAKDPGKVDLRCGRVGGKRDDGDSNLVSDLLGKVSRITIE